MRKSHRIKCRFCDYCIPTGYTADDGTYRDGGLRLVEHIKAQHPGAADWILRNTTPRGWRARARAERTTCP